jgi:2'-hydroxyisoflavone reductase
MEKGGEVLTAGDPATSIQLIDVRDLAEWSIRLAEKRAMGIYNVVGPAAHTTLAQLIEVTCHFASVPPKVTWVPSSWLGAQKDSDMWSNVLFWTFEPNGWAWSMQMSIDRALRDGLTCRSLSTTLTDVRNEYLRLPPERQSEFYWVRKTASAPGYALETITWPAYLEREREILTAWRAQQQIWRSP